MNLTESAESHIRSRMDKCAFEINICLQDQSRDGCYEDFLSALSKYGQAANQLEVLEKIKLQIQKADKENSNED